MLSLISRDRLVKSFLELVQVDSPSGEEHEIAKFILSNFREMKIPAKQDDFGNIVALLKGEGEPIVYSAHLDTVEPGKNIQPVINGNIISSQDNTILGADNKDAVASIIEVVNVIQAHQLKHRSLEIVLTVQEELISAGAKNLDYNLLNSKRCITFDGSHGIGKIIMSAPYCTRFEIIIKGKKAHSARPEQGVNAIKIACQAINQLPLGRVNKATTSNIAFINGGIAKSISEQKIAFVDEIRHNSVPDCVKLGGEIRGTDKDAFDLTVKQFESVFKSTVNDFNATCVFSSNPLASGYIHRKSDTWIQEIANGFMSIDIMPKFISSVGGGDANIFNLHNIKAVDIGSSYQKAHSTEEFLVVDDLVKLSEFMLSFVLKEG